MPRLTVSLSDEQIEWLESEADRRDRSKAHIVRELIDAHRTDEMITDEQITTSSDLVDRVGDLEERLEVLEDAQARETVENRAESDATETPARATGDERAASADPDVAETVEADDDIEVALAGWHHGRSDEERTASREIARRATEWLTDSPHDEVRKSDVPLDELADADPLDRDPGTLWTQVVRDAWTHAVDRGYIKQPHSRAYVWVADEGDGEIDVDVYDPTQEF